jgi:hypothetical protein
MLAAITNRISSSGSTHIDEQEPSDEARGRAHDELAEQHRCMPDAAEGPHAQQVGRNERVRQLQ